MVPHCAVESVHSKRQLMCGTTVYVHTGYVNITDKCCLVIWLPARVVSTSDTYHYAADLHAMFASKVVHVPVGHVREATHRAAATQAKRSKNRPRKKSPTGDSKRQADEVSKKPSYRSSMGLTET